MMKTYDQAISYIKEFSKSGKPIKDLSRFRGLMESLGNPQNDLKFIHIAGTNGKGSTLQFCAVPLTLSGYKVGEFTSPYIEDYRDRIRINGEWIPEESIAKYVDEIERAVGDNRDYSQFELTTAVAFLHFKSEKCDIVCLETGIGGLNDSTNVIKTTLVSVITSVSIDHINILGDTIQEIAVQKSGIIKENVPVVVSADNLLSTEEIMRETAERNNSKVYIPDEKSCIVSRCDKAGSSFIYNAEPYEIIMLGRHQVINALTAITVIEIIRDCGFSVSRGNLFDGLKKAFVPSRLEIISDNVILDGAHNPDGAKTLYQAVRQLGIAGKVTVICGMLSEKNCSENAIWISKFAKKVYTVGGFMSNAMPADDLAEIFRTNGTEAAALDSLERILDIVHEEEAGTLLVTGSLYLTSSVRKLLK